MTLAVELRPKSLNDIIGQNHLVGQNGIIHQMADKHDIKPMLLYGPPGTGKTTIARCLSNDANYQFIELNATNTKIAEIRKVIKEAKERDKKTLVFVDECHRWAKNIQDALLPHVEEGTICFIGATTEKPMFAVNSALLSRMLQYELKELKNKDLAILAIKAIKHCNIKTNKDAIKHLINKCGGDARKLLNCIECIADVLLESDERIEIEHVDAVMPDYFYHFDKSGNQHFDYAQNMQCAIQCSDANSAVYWLGKWLLSGEDPPYIARRILISASEDSCSNPMAAMIANNAYIAAKEIGYPECKIPMSHAVIAIAQSQRDRTANNAIADVESDIKGGRNADPVHANSDNHVSPEGYTKIDKQYVQKIINN